MLGGKQAEEAIVSTFNETENDGGGGKDAAELEEDQPIFSVKNALWHGGSAWDAWFSCSSNQVRYEIKNQIFLLFFYSHYFELASELIFYFFIFIFEGCSSVAYASILFFPTWNGFWNHFSSVLWLDWELDCLFNQCSLHRVSKQKGKRRCKLQESCHPGLSHSLISRKNTLISKKNSIFKSIINCFFLIFFLF